jgi:hypothetical protein
LRGDVNCDGFIDAADVIAYLLYLAELIAGHLSGCTFPMGEEIFVNVKIGDYDCDGLLVIGDSLLLLLYLGGVPEEIADCLSLGAPLPVS